MKNTHEQHIEELVSYLRSADIIDDAIAAMQQGQLVPYFQPKYNYATKQWCGAEALVRWIHPDLGFLPLDLFIPVFEKSGRITQLDLYIFEKVCAYQKKWKELKIPVLQVSVNFSQIDFAEKEFTDRVMDILKRYGMTCQDIRFEITETACAQSKNNIHEFINYVHEENFSIDMDDFGSGYSCLNMLDEIHVDSIKLDMNMTRKAGADRRSNNILKAVASLVRELGIDIYAEGVETKKQADYLFEIGCSYMQGYYFSKPLSPIAYQELLEKKTDPLSDLENQQEDIDDHAVSIKFQQAFEKYKKYSRKRRENSKTGYTGVSITPEGQYRADITFKGKRYFLGKFDSLEAAVFERKQAEKLNEEFFEEYYLAHPKAKRKNENTTL